MAPVPSGSGSSSRAVVTTTVREASGPGWPARRAATVMLVPAGTEDGTTTIPHQVLSLRTVSPSGTAYGPPATDTSMDVANGFVPLLSRVGPVPVPLMLSEPPTTGFK